MKLKSVPEALPSEYMAYEWDESIFPFLHQKTAWIVGFSACFTVLVLAGFNLKQLNAMSAWHSVPIVAGGFLIGMGICAFGPHFARCRKCGTRLKKQYVQVDYYVANHICEIRGYSQKTNDKIIEDAQFLSAFVHSCSCCRLKGLSMWCDSRED